MFFFTILKVYKVWFPVLQLSAGYGGIPDVYSLREENVSEQADNFEFASTVFLPFNFTRNRYYTGIIPIGKVKYSNPYIINDLQASGLNNISRSLIQINYELYAYHYLHESTRDLFPNFGQTLHVWYNISPYNEILKESIGAKKGSYTYQGFFDTTVYRLMSDTSNKSLDTMPAW